MTQEMLSGIAGLLLSLIFSYFPGVSGWYKGLNEEVKRLVMLGALFVVALAVVLISCGGYADYFGIQVACDESGIIELIKVFFLALIANQSVFLITPQKNRNSSG